MATSLGLVDSPTSQPNPLASAWGSQYFPSGGAVAASIPGWTGGMLPAPTIDPASGLPVIPGVATTPGSALPTTPTGNVIAPVPGGPAVIPNYIPPQLAPSFWEMYGPSIAAGLTVVGAVAVGLFVYEKVSR